MMTDILGILGSFIPLLVIGGIIFGIARLMSKRDRTTHESAGVAIRRFFQYAVMFVMLVFASVGVAGLIDAAISARDLLISDSTGTAISIAFTVVGLPVFVGLAIYTAGKLRTDPAERSSVAWAVYLTIVLIGSLITVMSLTGAFLAEILDQRSVDWTVAIYAFVWVIVWAGHWWAARQKGDPQRLYVQLLLGSAAGLIATFAGIAAGITVVLSQIYDSLFQASIIDTGLEPLAGALIILVVGVPVWWWYWFRHGRQLARGPLWLAYVLLLGILGGVIAVIIGTGVILFGVLGWLIGDPGNASAASHFTFLPVAIASVAAGAASWVYHGTLLGERDDRNRTEVDRVYDYLLAGAGLIVAASGVTTLITIALKALAGRGLTSFQSGNATAAALTLLLIGVPLWWRYWSTIQHYRKTDPDTELRSTTRRIYIFVLFGVAGIIAVVSLIVIVFIVFDDILVGDFGSITLDTASVPIALLITAGAIAGYHFAIFREDRTATRGATEPALVRVFVVGSSTDPIVGAIRSDIRASVTVIEAGRESNTAANLAEAIHTLSKTQQRSVVLIPREDGTYEILTTND